MKCILLILVLAGLGYYAYFQHWLLVEFNYPLKFTNPIAEAPITIEPRPLDEFTLDHLAQREYPSSPIILERVMGQGKGFTSYLFTYKSDGKKVSGMAIIPLPQADQVISPVIIMIRGFVDEENYQTGVGTWRAGEIFAQNGYIVLAPDFLGYGESDPPEDDIFWERLNRPVQILNLITSVGTLAQADKERIGLWGHSNGGQLALSILEITQKDYPTSLWAPVSKPFPYSILYYTDEFDDQGAQLRFELAKFEKLYDVHKYSIIDYLNRITAPIQLHQGTIDDSVPIEWSNDLTQQLKTNEIQVTYYTYPEADHNMSGSWKAVVQRDVEFFNKLLKADKQQM